MTSNRRKIQGKVQPDFGIDVRAALAELRVGPEALVVAGVSGGSDSMALACALLAAGRPLLVAHVNYALRGADSDGDERRVVAWCETHGVPLEDQPEGALNITLARSWSKTRAARNWNALIRERDA